MDSYEKLLDRALADLPDMETTGERFCGSRAQGIGGRKNYHPG
jgi:hypothetical protein